LLFGAAKVIKQYLCQLQKQLNICGNQKIVDKKKIILIKKFHFEIHFKQKLKRKNLKWDVSRIFKMWHTICSIICCM